MSEIGIVREVNGQLVLEDPVALGVIQAVEKFNCRNTFTQQEERVRHFANRVKERGLDPREVVIVLLNVDTPFGGALADALMPGHDWQQHRDKGEVPFARGLATRQGLLEALTLYDAESGRKLQEATGLAVLVADHGVTEVFHLG